MSVELINRMTIKEDGVYVSTHSNNDDSPFHSVKIDFLTEAYRKGGQRALDREFINMLFEYCDLRGSHKSIIPYKNAIQRAWNNISCNKLINEYRTKSMKAYHIANRFDEYKSLSEEEAEKLYNEFKPEVEEARKKRNEYVVSIVEEERRNLQKAELQKNKKKPKELAPGIYEIIPVHGFFEGLGERWSEYMNFNANNGTVVYDKTLGHCVPSPEHIKISDFHEMIYKKGVENISGAKEFLKFIIDFPEIYMMGIDNEGKNQEQEEEEENGQDY